MVELITGPLPYFESLPILIKTFNWINENGYTDKKCAFQFNINFDEQIYPDIPKIEDLNILKFVLGFDENYIYLHTHFRYLLIPGVPNFSHDCTSYSANR